VRPRVVLALLACAAALLVAAPDALAHGIVGREDLPIPRWLFGWGATAVLVVSFVGLAVLWPAARLERTSERPVLRLPRWLDPVGGAIGIALFAIVVWAGLAGTQSQTANLAPTFVWVLFWVGVTIASVLFGDVFRWLNPWRAVGRLAGWVILRIAPNALPEPVAYPHRLGRWPAVAGLFVFAWIELVVPVADRNDPSLLGVLALAYAATQLVGMAVYGVEAWTRNADPFAVYFRVLSRISPLDWRDGALYVRPPLSGLTRLRTVPGTVPLLIVAIGSTTFDGLSENPLWTDPALELQEVFTGLGLGATNALEVAYTIGLVTVIGLCGLLYWLGVVGMRTVDPRRDPVDLARRFVHSLVPIAFAYVLAHYFSLFIYQGQATAYLASDPLGRGWDLFGTAGWTIDYGVVGANGIWLVQVGALVAGHVAGLVLAHDRALVVFDDVKRATRSQYWMLAVMIAFTCLGLWLLSASNA
jgi:hypothetical protein